MAVSPLCLSVPVGSRSSSTTALSRCDQIRERVSRSDPALDRECSTFRAAVILLAAVQVGQNVDRLARFTGYEREFVARCARRLCDNGVWRAGETVCTWGAAAESEPAFWSDVQVAEGRLCRQLDDEGSIQWAPSGVWHKSYDFVERTERADLADLSVRYLPRVEPEPHPAFPSTPPREGVGSPGVGPRQHAASAVAPEPRRGSPPDLGSGSPRARERRPQNLLVFASQFSDAIWLG